MVEGRENGPDIGYDIPWPMDACHHKHHDSTQFNLACLVGRKHTAGRVQSEQATILLGSQNPGKTGFASFSTESQLWSPARRRDDIVLSSSNGPSSGAQTESNFSFTFQSLLMISEMESGEDVRAKVSGLVRRMALSCASKLSRRASTSFSASNVASSPCGSIEV